MLVPYLVKGQTAAPAALHPPPHDRWARMERFLIAGSERGLYRAGRFELVPDDAPSVVECLGENGLRTVQTIAAVAQSGRVCSTDPTLLTLAMAASPAFADGWTNASALESLPQVARTGSQLCRFAAYVDNLRGWGRGLRSAVANWYLDKAAPQLARLILKSRPSGGWSHRDLLRLAHPRPKDDGQNAVFQWVLDGKIPENLPRDLRLIEGAAWARRAVYEDDVVRLVEEFSLTHEMLPTRWKQSPRVWEALLDEMPYAAMLRYLGKLSALGLLQQAAPASALMVARLMDRARILRSRVSPVTVLAALARYRQGGSGWGPIPSISRALDEAFHISLRTVEPSGRRLYVAIDAGPAMELARCFGLPQLTAGAASAALALQFTRTGQNPVMTAFHEILWHLDLGPEDRLDRALRAVAPGGESSDLSLPVQNALQRGLRVDGFVILTSHLRDAQRAIAPAIEGYRQRLMPSAKLVVVGAAERAAPEFRGDPRNLWIAGFDASTPTLISEFLR